MQSEVVRVICIEECLRSSFELVGTDLFSEKLAKVVVELLD